MPRDSFARLVSRGHATFLPVVSIAAALAFGGCATYDQDEAENSITDDFSEDVEAEYDLAIESASCPEDVDASEGTEFDCTAMLENGEEVQVHAEFVNDEGEASFEIDAAELASAASK